ncbi:inositol monophosphatase family protein [Hyphococcus luteus]|uniref:Histidinol-phosphatase n=1 Tax=Hyphococcus luteus TaxID=2058213 RepID=A0A2S7K8C2_9PROT|nr:inositol monophosphatase family protein [Marinicaulis flavus]PQA88755.1 histidinol-phosphatase [Marinicaulis flavus]
MSFSQNDLSEYAAFAGRLADAARGESLTRFRKGATIFNKAGPWFDPVTDADREAERALRRMIESVYPGHGLLGEEFGEREGEGAWRWVLDPVDGTRAFMCGTVSWTTLIALEHDGAPVLGMIDQPFTDERWLSVGGKTVYTHGDETRDVKTSGLKDIAKARLSTTDPLPTGYFSDAEAAAFARVAKAARVARYSLDAYAYGLLAMGEIDLVIESALQRYDYAALLPVIEGAGGVVTNWQGERPGSDDKGEIIAAATPELHAAALALLAG